MKKALFTIVTCIVLPVLARAQFSTSDRYEKLINKDLATAIKLLNLKDTTGKTIYVYAPQIEKGTKFTGLKLDNGDILAFDEKRFRAVFPAQKTKE